MSQQYLIAVNDGELHNIIAALRLWQRKGYCDPHECPLDLLEIACPEDDTPLPSDHDVDMLCMRLNCDSLDITDFVTKAQG
jgi:hypothetical protein